MIFSLLTPKEDQVTTLRSEVNSFFKKYCTYIFILKYWLLYFLRNKNTACSMQKKLENIEKLKGNSLVVQWLELHASTAGGMGSVPGWGAKILHAIWCSHTHTKV